MPNPVVQSAFHTSWCDCRSAPEVMESASWRLLTASSTRPSRSALSSLRSRAWGNIHM